MTYRINQVQRDYYWRIMFILMALSMLTFAWLAIKNARPLDCDTISTDEYGYKTCIIRVEEKV